METILEYKELIRSFTAKYVGKFKELLKTNKKLKIKVIVACSILCTVTLLIAFYGIYQEIDRINRNGFEFKLMDDKSGYIVIDYNGGETSVVIPSEYRGKPVKEVWCLGKFENLVHVTIPNTVIAIRHNTDRYCTSLQSVTFEENSQLQYIGGVVFGGSLIESIVIPDTVTHIDKLAFTTCVNLKSIFIPSTVVTMGFNVFPHCDSLSAIYCEAEEKPEGWDLEWNLYDIPVVWGYVSE